VRHPDRYGTARRRLHTYLQGRFLLTPAIEQRQNGDLVATADARRAWPIRGTGRLPDYIAGTMSLRQVFLDNLVSGAAAHLTLAPGIKACALHAGKRPGLALHIAREALQAGQLRRVLERRFELAVLFDGCFIYLDAQNALVIWHALSASHEALDRTLSRMLSLANLEALDARAIC
jgi:hypothetical protein